MKIDTYVRPINRQDSFVNILLLPTYSNMVFLLLFLSCFFSPFESSSCFNFGGFNLSRLVTLATSLSFLFVLLTRKLSYKPDYNDGLLILGFITPFILALTVGMTTTVLFIPNGMNYENPLSDILGRLLNYANMFVFYFAAKYFTQSKKYQSKEFLNKFIRFYWFACLIAILFSVWQAVSFYFPSIPFPFEGMRTRAHSVGDLRNLIPGRVTGLSDEPSYVVPMIIDFILITCFCFKSSVKKKTYLLIALIVLFLTFAGSAGLNVLLLFFSFLVIKLPCFFKQFKKMCLPKKAIPVSILLLLSIVIIFFVNLNTYFQFFTIRLSNAFDTEQHGRAYKTFMPFLWSLDSYKTNILFGHGPKSYALIKQRYTARRGGEFQVTSNNIYTDIYWEHGLLGFCGLIFLFCGTLLKLKETYSKSRPLTLFAFYMLIHLFSSSTYRSDFASSRFFIVFIIISLIINSITDKRSLNGKSNCA